MMTYHADFYNKRNVMLLQFQSLAVVSRFPLNARYMFVIS